MRFLKIFITGLLSSILIVFFLWGTVVIYLFQIIIPISILAAILVYFLSVNNKYLSYDNNGIYYKKHKILYTDIKKVIFDTIIFSYRITFNNLFSKKYFNLNNLSKEQFYKLKSVILENIDTSRTIIKKRNYFWTIPLLIYIIPFIVPLILNSSIHTVNIKFNNSIIQRNTYTDHYLFNMENVEFKTVLDNRVYFVLTKNGKIMYFEDINYVTELKNDFATRMENKLDLSRINDWFSNPIGIMYGWSKYSLIRSINPLLIETEDYRCVITDDETGTKFLAITNRKSDYFLRFIFEGDFDMEYVMDLIKSISYKEF